MTIVTNTLTGIIMVPESLLLQHHAECSHYSCSEDTYAIILANLDSKTFSCCSSAGTTSGSRCGGRLCRSSCR